MDGSPTKERMSRSAGDTARQEHSDKKQRSSSSFANLPRPEGLSLAASKKWEKEREKEAKKIKKKEEKDRRRRSKSEKKKKKKDKATATTNATTGDQPPFALQPPATLQADGWSCSACTYWNAASAVICEICTSVRIRAINISGPLPTPSDSTQQAAWWFCSACTFRNLPAAMSCDACGTHRSPTALLDVEGLPSAFLEVSGAPQVFGPASLAGTPPDRGSAASSRTQRRSKEDKKGAKGHRRMPTVDRQENDDFWVPEAEEESDADDADDDRAIIVDREQFKKLSRSDNSLAHDDNDDEVLRPDIREEIDRREKELEAKRCAEEARRKKEEEDSIPLELELIEKTEFYCTHDHWEDELYSDEEDSSDPVDDLLEAALNDRGSKQYEYYSEDGATTSTTPSSLQSSANTSSQQRRGRSGSSGRDEEAEPLVQAAADHYEEVASTQVLIETRTPQRHSDSRLRTESAGIVDVYELVAETTAKPPPTRDQVASSGYVDDESEGADEDEAERRDRQQGYTVVNGRQHLMESRGGKSDHYCYDGNDSSSSAVAADRKGKQKEAELVREQYKAAIPREEPAAAATAGGCLDEEELMAQLLAADDSPVPASEKRPEVPTPPTRSQKTKTKKKEKREKRSNKSTQQVKQHYKPTQEDNYLEDVVEAVDCLRTEKKSKKAQLRDSLYYTDGGDDGDSSESETETETESESDDSDSVDTDAVEDDDDRTATGGGVQDSGDRRAREVADEEEELFRLALLRTSGEEGKEPSADKEESSGTTAAAAIRRVSSPPAVVVSTHPTPLAATAAPANPPLSPINPAKLAYAALASMSPTTSSKMRATDSEDETARSTRSLSAPAARLGDRSVGGNGRTSVSSSTSVIPSRMRSTTQSLMLFADMRFPEHSRKMAVMSKKSDQFLHEMVTRCQALFPIVATHLVRIQSVYEHRQKLQRFVGMQLESQESRKDSGESVRIGQKNLIPRLQRAIRLARRANFLLYGDVGSTMRFIGTVYTSAELAVRANDSLFQMTCDYLHTLISTEELAAIYRVAMLRSSSTSKSSCHVAICSFARARHQLRLSTIELKRANDFLKRTITQRSVLDVLQSSALSLVQATRQMLVQFKQEQQQEDDVGGLPRSNGPHTPRTAATVKDERRHQVEWLENAVRSVESRLCVEEDRGAERNWNKEFQDILDSFSISKTEKELEAGQAALVNRGQQADKLCTLAKDFVAAAKMYGKIIISEVFLPYKQKTIKPISIGGVAGGEKYIHRGILFKFAMDWEGLYGGDEYSAKVASHELKGLARYFSCAVRGLHFPLMALIDYRGFRLTASSILPISHADTLIYGSCDMGATVKDDNKVLSKLMEKAGRQMNIKGHLAGKNGDAFLYAPTDIEGHLGRDRRFYVLDFARTFPPATPNIQTHPRGFLYQLLRPEFVFAYHKPLSSDAFMVFGKKSNATDNPEIREATNHLLNTVIPGFANWLERHFEEDDERVLTSTLSVLLHREGINNRYLGVVRIHCRNPRLRHFLLREMIARVVKNIMRAEMRDKTKNVHWQRMAQAPSSQPRIELGHAEEDHNQETSFAMVVARFFNVVIGLEGERSKEFWDVQMREKLEHSFPEAQLSQVPIRLSSADFLPLFERIQQLGGIRLSKQVLKELEETPEKVIFAYPDITKLRSRVTHMNIVEESEALSMKLTALKTDNTHLALRMLRYSRDHYEAAVRASTDNPKTLYRLADVLKELAKREPGPLQLKIELGDSSIERFLAAYALNRSDEKVIYQTGNVACELGETIRSAHFYVKARECFVTALKLGSQPHYEKEVTEKALALMERAETNLSVVDFEGAFQLFRAVLTVRPDDVLIIFLCAEICFSWARTLGDSKDGTSPPYKKAIKYYQKVVDIARKTNKTASPSTEERRQPHTQSDVSSKRPRLPFLNELEGMSHVLTSTSESYEKFLNNIIGKENTFYKKKKSSSEKFRSSLAARGIGGSMHMMLSSLSDHHHHPHRHHSSGSSEDSPASSPSPRGWSSGRRTWHRKEKKEKEKEKDREKDLKKTRKHSKKEGHHVEELTTAGAAESPPSFGRRLSLKLPRSPRGATTEQPEGTGGDGESPESMASMKHANSAPQLLPIPTPTPGHGPTMTASSPTPGHHSHHLVSKLFSSTRRFSSAGKKEAMAAKADKWGTGDYTTALHPGGLADTAEAERKKKEAEDLRKKEEKEREDKRQQERERERRVRDPWRCIYVLFRLRLALYNDLTRSFPGLGMFWLRMGHMLVEHVHEAMLTHDLQPSQEKEFLDQAAGHYAKALTLNPNYVGVLQQDYDSLYITNDGDPRTEAPPGAIEALYRPMRDILQVAQTSSILQVELGNACSKLQMRKLFLAPVAPQISDPTLTAIIKGGSGGVPLALEELSLSCCAQVSGPCLERLAPYLATTLTTLRLKGLTEGPTQQYCSLIKSCKKLQQLSMPHCCYQDTYKPLQILYSHCRNLTSLDFGVMSVICWKDEFEDLARSSQGLTSLDLYYLHNLTSSFVDQFLSACKHLRRLRLPCLTPYAVKKSSKRRAEDGDVGKQPIEGGGISYSDEVLKKWAHKYATSFAQLEELHMDGYSNLTYSSMLPLVETFKSLRVLHLENNRGLDDRCLIRLTSHCTSLTTLHLAHCVNIGDASLTVVARTCPQLSILNVALTKIGGGGVEAIAQHCPQLRELSLGCPFRLRDDVLKNLIYNSFVNLKRLALFRAAKAQLKYSINSARTKGIQVEFDRNTMLPAYVAKKCPEARKQELKRIIRRIFSEDIAEQAGALRLLAYEFFVPFDSTKAEDNKRYFAKLGGIPRLLKLMGPGNHHEVRIKATKAVWNFASTEELQRLLLGEGVLGPIIDSLQAVIPELQEASAGALWPYLEFEDVGEKALELGVVEALLPIMNTAKVQPRWHMLGCLVSIAENVTCAKELVAKGAARISEYCANPEELLITRYLSAVTLGFLSLDSFMEDDLIDDGALEKIENFMFETKSPDAIARSEDSVTNDQGVKWKFIRPFLRLTYSRHPPVQRLGAFALAVLSKRPVNVKTMVEEGLLGRLVCLSWSHDSRLRNLIGITLKAIYDRYDATIGKSISIVPTLEQIAIHTVQHDGNLCGLSAWLSTPEGVKLPEALRQRMEVKVLLASRQNLEKKVVYRGGPLS